MAKSKIPDAVFGNIINGKAYDTFLNVEDATRVDLIQCKKRYKWLIDKNMIELELLVKLEETITQIRCQELAFNEIKLSNVRGYIYARGPFIKNGSKLKDLRVIVGKTVDYGDDLDVLLKDEEFVIKAKKKLTGQMAMEITGNLMDVSQFEESLKVTV